VAITPWALGLVSAVRTHHTLLVLSNYFTHKAGNCTLEESFESEALARLQSQNVDEIQSASRIIQRDNRYSLWSTPAGEYWAPAASGGALLYDLGEQKRNIYGNLVRPGDTVLDAGANVGVFTRKALWAGAAKVVAIEPAPENLECLRRTFAAEIRTGRVVVYNKGIWDKDDILKFSVDPTNSARDTFVRQIEAPQFLSLTVTTLDKIVEELHVARVDVIKMDIEGAERRAVTGAKKTIAKFRPRMALCIYHVPGDETIVPKLVTDIVSGYAISKTCLCASDRIQPEVAFFD
jgi:FkbM family methyltransferase